MIHIQRDKLINQLQEMELDKSNNCVIDNAMNGDGKVAVAFLVKRRKIHLEKEQLQKELDIMVNESLCTIIQYEEMSNLLNHDENGTYRVSNFMRKKRRIYVG